MKTILEKINDCIDINEKYNQTAGIRGMDLIPTMYNSEPSIVIGDAVHYNETKVIKQIMMAASAIGLTAPNLDEYLEEYEMIPEEDERFALVYSLVQGKHPELIWVPISEGTIEYEF